MKIIIILIYNLILCECSLSSNQNHEEWSVNDPRWQTLKPNWWESNFEPPTGPKEELSKHFWISKGQEILQQKLKIKNNHSRAKNVIIMIGDGMGLSSVMAARSYIDDVSTELSFEKFPHVGLSKTYCVNYQVPDSACTGTAILRGVKNNYGVIGAAANVNLNNCSESHTENAEIPSIFKYAQDARKSTGIVTTTRVTHSTPATAYASSANRLWESDSSGIPAECDDIAKQLIHGEVGKKLDVILGGGLGNLTPAKDGGKRTDGNNLVEDYKKKHKNSTIVTNKVQLNAVNAQKTSKLLGLFAKSHMDFKLQADKNQPTLTEMTAKALEVLKKNEQNGYMLFIEGGRIDRAHHENQARLALEEVVEFHKAVEYVKQNTNEDETLIIVTADHSHPFFIGGYLPRGRNILGPGDWSREDSKWIFSASYAHGQGFYDHFDRNGQRKDPKGMTYMDPSFKQPAGVPMDEGTHSGEDVPVFASGPYSHLFTGVFEQHYIAHAITYAACIGPSELTKNPEC